MKFFQWSDVLEVEVLMGELGTKKLPNLPMQINGSSMVLHNRTILLCGGSDSHCLELNNMKKCLQLKIGSWEEHSTLNKERVYHSTVTTKTAIFIFGGLNSRNTYEYLPTDATTWLMGKTEIPGGFAAGCAIAVKSEQEIWLIGGVATGKRILGFNVKDHTFQILPSQLMLRRANQRCGFIPNTNKIMITGGDDGDDNSTEILDTEDGTVTMASPMNSKRIAHGMGVVTINGEDRLAVFGGYERILDLLDGLPRRNCPDSIELYNTQKNKWEIADFKLNQGISYFGFLTVKLSHIITSL